MSHALAKNNPLSELNRDDDPFEAMQISKSGAVTIWTQNRIWQVVTTADGSVEKLSNILEIRLMYKWHLSRNNQN